MLMITGEQFSEEDLSLCEQAENFLGNSICDFEYLEAKRYAEHKLFNHIIPREGDMDGKRLEPCYLAMLIQEAVSQDRFSRYCETEFRHAPVMRDDATHNATVAPKARCRHVCVHHVTLQSALFPCQNRRGVMIWRGLKATKN